MTMNSRALNNRVTISRQQTVRDAAGQPMMPWVDVRQEWADIRHLSGIGAMKAGADTTAVRASVRVRTGTEGQPGRRLTHGTTVYEIEAVLPDTSARDHVFLACKQVQ